MPMPGSISIECNICGNTNQVPVELLQREHASCLYCRSTVRMRGMIHALSIALFNQSYRLDRFPVNKSITGIGMSDWLGYSVPLAEKLDYTNTYYHQEPQFDITEAPEKSEYLDFVMSTDVFEHVAPPVSRAFENTFQILKNDGAFVFSVPYTLDSETVEHFPNLHNFHIDHDSDPEVLHNVTKSGEKESFNDLVFHGGSGDTLEMRVFCLDGILKELDLAGFKDVVVMTEPCWRYGIYWPIASSLPLIARKATAPFRVVEWGPKAVPATNLAAVDRGDVSSCYVRTDANLTGMEFSVTVSDIPSTGVFVDGDTFTFPLPQEITSQHGYHSINAVLKKKSPIYIGEILVTG